MGLLDDFEMDLEDINPAGEFERPSIGEHSFEVGSFYIDPKGTRNKPGEPVIRLEYLLDDEGQTFQETWPVVTGVPTAKEKTRLSFFKQRMITLGLDEDQANNPDPEDIEGLTGTLTIKWTGEYANIDKLYVDNDDTETTFDEPEPEPVKPAKAASKKAAAEPARRPRPSRPSADDDPFSA